MLDHRFPIIIMTRNEDEHLETCISYILLKTSIPIKIYIIDNNSTSKKQISYLNSLSDNGNIEIVKNKNNLWILGLNKTIKEIKNKHTSKYFVLSDGDIDVSNCSAEPCWLSYLISKMDSNISLGKIGISLDWSFLKENPELNNILNQEMSLYDEARKIDDLYVSCVDTTLAIYRWDWSINKNSSFYPDHIRYLRPELYSCRTDKNIVVKHLGWESYLINTVDQNSINSKVLCFALVGGDVKSQILTKSNLPYKLFYRLFSKIIKRGWLLKRVFHLFIYMVTKGWRRSDGYGVR